MDLWAEIKENQERGARRLVAECGDRLFTAAFLLCRMGRGISWSAAVTALIAAAELVLLIPSLPVFGQAADPGGTRKAQTGKTGTKSAENPDEKKK